jgi:hypothetical protein
LDTQEISPLVARCLLLLLLIVVGVVVAAIHGDGGLAYLYFYLGKTVTVAKLDFIAVRLRIAHG